MFEEIIQYEKTSFEAYVNLIGSANYPFPNSMIYKALPFHTIPHEVTAKSKYFPRNDTIDYIAEEAASLLRKLFNFNDEYKVDLQPWSGTQANQIVYNAVLNKDEKILVFDLKSGGHVSYVNYPKKFFKVSTFSTNKNGEIDYEDLDDKINTLKPKLVVAGGSSYVRNIDYALVSKSCKKVGALLLADIAHRDIHVISSSHPSPFNYADFVTTTTHKALRGPRGGILIYKKDFESEIKNSTFPTTQGSPDIPSLLSKLSTLKNNTKELVREYSLRSIENMHILKSGFEQAGCSLVTGGADMHIILVDVSCLGKTGHEIEKSLQDIHILTNRNSTFDDKLKPSVASGIRAGSLGITTLNYTKEEIEFISESISKNIMGYSIDAEEIKSLAMRKISRYMSSLEESFNSAIHSIFRGEK